MIETKRRIGFLGATRLQFSLSKKIRLQDCQQSHQNKWKKKVRQLSELNGLWLRQSALFKALCRRQHRVSRAQGTPSQSAGGQPRSEGALCSMAQIHGKPLRQQPRLQTALPAQLKVAEQTDQNSSMAPKNRTRKFVAACTWLCSGMPWRPTSPKIDAGPRGKGLPASP